jgi:hypothetical protein
MAKKIATFKHEVELEGESVGPVYVVDPDNPQDVETLDWMLLSAARALAEENGYEFTED